MTNLLDATRCQRAILPLLMGWLVSNVFSQGGEVSKETDFPPKKFEASRYDAIWEKNPFTSQVTVIGEPSEDVESWAKGYILRSVTRVNGKYMVHIENTTPPKAKDPVKGAVRYHRLTEDEPSRHGLTIVRVKSHRDPSQVEVTVGKQDGDDVTEALIKYDPRALAAKPAAQPGVRLPGSRVARPGAPNQEVPTTNAAPQRGRTQQSAAPATRGRRGSQAGGDATQAQGGGRIQGRVGQGRRGGGRAQGGDTDNATSKRRVILPPGTSR